MCRRFFLYGRCGCGGGRGKVRRYDLRGTWAGAFMNSKTRTALITGASGGIGYELAKLFARDHYNLVLVARSRAKLNQVAAELQSQFGVTVKTVGLNLAAPPAPKFLFDQLEREGLKIDVL